MHTSTTWQAHLETPIPADFPPIRADENMNAKDVAKRSPRFHEIHLRQSAGNRRGSAFPTTSAK